MTDKELVKIDRKRLERLYGKREASRLIADALCWERMTRRGQVPRFISKPVLP